MGQPRSPLPVASWTALEVAREFSTSRSPAPGGESSNLVLLTFRHFVPLEHHGSWGRRTRAPWTEPLRTTGAARSLRTVSHNDDLRRLNTSDRAVDCFDQRTDSGACGDDDRDGRGTATLVERELTQTPRPRPRPHLDHALTEGGRAQLGTQSPDANNTTRCTAKALQGGSGCENRKLVATSPLRLPRGIRPPRLGEHRP